MEAGFVMNNIFLRPGWDVFQVCLSIVAFSVLIDVGTNWLDHYFNQRITNFKMAKVERDIYRPLLNKFGKYMGLIDAVLNILVANFIGMLSDHYLIMIFWIGVILLVIELIFLLKKYHKLFLRIKATKLKSQEIRKEKRE